MSSSVAHGTAGGTHQDRLPPQRGLLSAAAVLVVDGTRRPHRIHRHLREWYKVSGQNIWSPDDAED